MGIKILHVNEEPDKLAKDGWAMVQTKREMTGMCDILSPYHVYMDTCTGYASTVNPQIPGNRQAIPRSGSHTCQQQPKCSTRAIIALINNLGILYHQYCSSSYLDYFIIFGPFCCLRQWKSSSNLIPTRQPKPPLLSRPCTDLAESPKAPSSLSDPASPYVASAWTGQVQQCRVVRNEFKW
jgi:hypothetical protein